MAAELGLPRPTGAMVNAVTPGSPAERANLHVGDVILEFNHVNIDDDSHLVNVVGMTEVGKQVPLLVFRNRQTVHVNIELGDRAKFNLEQPAAESHAPAEDRQ